MVRSSGFELVLKNLSWVYVIPKYQILKNSTGNIQIHPESINIYFHCLQKFNLLIDYHLFPEAVEFFSKMYISKLNE